MDRDREHQENREELRNLLSIVLNYDDDLIERILETCASLIDFFSCRGEWRVMFDLNREQYAEAYEYYNNILAARIQANMFDDLISNYPDNVVIETQETYNEKFIRFVEETSKKELTKLQRHAYESALHFNIPLQQQIDEILPASTSNSQLTGLNLAVSSATNSYSLIARALSSVNPSYLTNLGLCTDEVTAYIMSFSVEGVIRANLLSGLGIYVLMSSLSICKLYGKCSQR